MNSTKYTPITQNAPTASFEDLAGGSACCSEDEEQTHARMRNAGTTSETATADRANKKKSTVNFDAVVEELHKVDSPSCSDDTTDAEKIHVEYFDEPRSLKQRLQLYFIQNRRSSLFIRLFNVLIKLLACLLYVIRVCKDTSVSSGICRNCSQYSTLLNFSIVEETDFLYCPLGINSEPLFWVERATSLWIIQVIVAFISFVQTLLICYIQYKGSLVQVIYSRTLLLEVVTTVPFLVSVFWPPLRLMYVPSFLSCWLAKMLLQDLVNDLHRAMQRSQSALTQQILILATTAFCLIFTSTCGIQHLQRGGRQQLTLFQSFYFVIVTFSTVGYGELYPDIWISQLFVILMICVAFVVLPGQLEQLAYTWMERQKSGGEYSKHRAQHEKHVVVCTTNLRADTVLDFLNEFYADPMHSDYFVVLLSPCELDATMRMVLQIPVWAERVIYIKGSALRANDLERARMTEAKGCFILASRNYPDKNAADQHAILRSWAVKDYAPLCKQYVQIFRPENKMHVKHAEFVVCEDEFKYALLANNCICPGLSTFITLLLHTSRGEEGQHSSEQWHRIYGRHSGNEIYHIQLSLSKFFAEFEAKSFTYASFHAHKKYGVCLLAVQRAKPGSTLQLNPGPRHTMKGTDVCYYMSITREEQTTFVSKTKLSTRSSATRLANTIAGIGTVALELQHTRNERLPDAPSDSPNVTGQLKVAPANQTNAIELPTMSRRPSIAAVPDVLHEEDEDRAGSCDKSSISEQAPPCDQCGGLQPCQLEKEYMTGFPPVTPYIGTSATLCYLNKDKKPFCCLQLAQTCEHCSCSNAKAYQWHNPAIILAADHASNGIYNFIIPLRAHCLNVHCLEPVVLLLEQKPTAAYLDTLSWFPMVYWMHGNIETIDHLLRAGINLAEHVVVVNKETSNSAEDDYLADCNTIVAVQTMYRLFPCVRIITELAHSSNMRFMQFNAKDLYALHQSQIEKKEKERGSYIAYMFRLPFAAGNVFSATMLDTLLYQTFGKEYLIQFVRLLLGIDQTLGSGHLSAIEIKDEDVWIRNYGRLYQKFCSTAGDIPLGIFRTQVADTSVLTTSGSSLRLDMRDIADIWKRKYTSKYLVSERHEIANLVRCRMESLGLSLDDYSYLCDKRNHISYVIINPAADLKLEVGDVVYVIRPHVPLLRHSPLSGLQASSTTTETTDHTQSQLAYGRRRRTRFTFDSKRKPSATGSINSSISNPTKRANVPRVTITSPSSTTVRTPREDDSHSQMELLITDETSNNGQCPMVYADDNVNTDEQRLIISMSSNGSGRI